MVPQVVIGVCANAQVEGNTASKAIARQQNAVLIEAPGLPHRLFRIATVATLFPELPFELSQKIIRLPEFVQPIAFYSMRTRKCDIFCLFCLGRVVSNSQLAGFTRGRGERDGRLAGSPVRNSRTVIGRHAENTIAGRYAVYLNCGRLTCILQCKCIGSIFFE